MARKISQPIKKDKKPADLRLILPSGVAEDLRARAASEHRPIQTQALVEIMWALSHRTSESPV